MTRPETPSLRGVEDALELIARRLPEIAEGARWAWPMGYERRRGERSGGGGQVNRPTEAAVGHSWWRCEPGCRTHPKGGEMHPPTPEWTMREQVDRIGTWVLQAAALCEASVVALERVGKAAGKGDQPSASKEELMVKTATRVEVERANKAKAKRDAGRVRGVGYGEY